MTVFVLNGGRLSDMYGRKRLDVLGFSVFTLAALNSSAIAADAFPKSQLGVAIGTNQMMIAAFWARSLAAG